MKTVTDEFRELHAKYEVPSVDEGRKRFLGHLEDALPYTPLNEVAARAIAFLNREAPHDASWFAEFERDPKVLADLRTYINRRLRASEIV